MYVVRVVSSRVRSVVCAMPCMHGSSKRLRSLFLSLISEGSSGASSPRVGMTSRPGGHTSPTTSSSTTRVGMYSKTLAHDSARTVAAHGNRRPHTTPNCRLSVHSSGGPTWTPARMSPPAKLTKSGSQRATAASKLRDAARERRRPVLWPCGTGES